MPRPPNIPNRKLSHSSKFSPHQNQVAQFIDQGFIFLQQGRLNEAQAVLEKALSLQVNNFDALQLLGALSVQTGQFVKAVDLLTRALQINPNLSACYSNLGIALKELRCFEEALVNYDKAISIAPDDLGAHYNRGNVLKELKRFEEAITSFDKAISIKHDYAEAYSNRSLSLQELKRFEDALISCDRAISIKPDYVEAHSNRGNALKELRRFEEALISYDKAISIRPDYAELYFNRGNTLKALQRFDEAMTHYDKTLSLKADYVNAWVNAGSTLISLKRYEEALDVCQKALQIDPDSITQGQLQAIRMVLCDWENFDSNLANIIDKITNVKKVITPFVLFSLTDCPEIQKICVENFYKDQYWINNDLGVIPIFNQKQKIRVGYFSSDFRNHAVSFATAELYECHDKNQFEIFAFSFGDDDQSPIRKRLMQTFDQFIDVSTQSDREIAVLARDLGIDIAINLNGFTENERTDIFAYRAAPIQVSYIGYLGTMGLEYIDYLIADEKIIPNGAEKYFSEKIVRLPHYQAGDSQRKISEKKFTRQELGLPENGFVFAAFNNNYKILPATFAGWMNILHKVTDSVLWVYVSNTSAVDNIKAEAIKHGIKSSRIIFATSLPQDEHLARYSMADLFLDTFPCNGGSTVVDALWAGLPVLTLMGESFASRVAASSLEAIHLPKLITHSQEQYEDLAVDLAMNPNRLADIKMKLASNRLTTPLFDTPSLTKHLEAAYTQMMERYWNDSLPEHINIEVQ